MFNKKNLVFSLIILTALVFSLTGIVGAQDDVTELRISWWGSETRHEATLEAIELYEEMNPDIDLIPEYAGFEGYRNKLMSQVTAGNAPDIYTTVMEWYPDLLELDGLTDITGMVDVSGHNPKYVEASSMNGNMYGVNLSVNGMVLNQNVTLLEELGVEPLESPYTWEDMKNKFTEVYEKSDGQVYGAPDWTTVREGMGFDIFKYFGYSKLGRKGAFPFNNQELTFTEDDVKAFFQYFDDLRESNAVAPTELSSLNDFSANSLLIRRDVAFEINYSGTFGRYQDQTEDELVMTPLPVGPNGESGDLARPGLIFSVAKNSEHVEEAAEFIEWFTTSPEAAKVLKTSRGVLPTTTQRQALLDEDGILSETDKKVMAVVDKILERELKLAYAGPSGYGDLASVVFPEYGQRIGYGDMTVEEAAAELMEEVDEMGN
jgi:ABC-type glycerol-3-phosphate transport system substrate-binding protein